MCYDQASVKKFRRALTKYSDVSNSSEEEIEIMKESREKASKQDNTDIETGVTCTIEETLGEERRELEASKLQVYVWQIPFMLLTMSIIMFVVGLNIWVFEAATRELTWGDDRKVQIPLLSFSNVLFFFVFFLLYARYVFDYMS
jgi:hypothetical protein